MTFNLSHLVRLNCKVFCVGNVNCKIGLCNCFYISNNITDLLNMWICNTCKEENEEQFDTCWNCVSTANDNAESEIPFDNPSLVQEEKPAEEKEEEAKPDNSNGAFSTFTGLTSQFYNYDNDISFKEVCKVFLMRMVPITIFGIVGSVFGSVKADDVPDFIVTFFSIVGAILVLTTIAAIVGFVKNALSRLF